MWEGKNGIFKQKIEPQGVTLSILFRSISLKLIDENERKAKHLYIIGLEKTLSKL